MRKVFLLAFVIGLALPSLALAQRTTATVRGTVRDATQGLLPGVTVTATNEDTGLVRSVVSNESGVILGSRSPHRPLQDRRRVVRLQEGLAHERRAPRGGRLLDRLRARRRRRQRNRQRRGVGNSGQDPRRRRLRRHHRRAGARAAAERTQLPAARDVDAGRERARLPERQRQGTARRIGPLGQRQRRHRESLVGRRREQQRRRLEPHDSGVPVARGDPGVQDSPQQLRSRVRRRRRRADQHRHAGRHESLQRNAHSTRAAATR